MNVVFTGPAFDSLGQSVARSNLISACKAVGYVVQSSVRGDTDLLVASRTDTVKAKTAEGQGKKVMTYPEFIGQFLSGIEIPTEGRPVKYTDQVDLNLLVPDFTVGFDALNAA